jgi:hypothetical protein
MKSCQITGIPSETWLAFRLICLEEGVSANQKLRQLIEEQVKLSGGQRIGWNSKIEQTGKLNRGESNERQD